MGYTAWSVVFGEQPSASKWNILGANDASFNDGSGIASSAIITAKIADSAATTRKIKPSVINFKDAGGSNFTTTSGTGVDVTGMSTTYQTGPTNERIFVWLQGMILNSTVASGEVWLSINGVDQRSTNGDISEYNDETSWDRFCHLYIADIPANTTATIKAVAQNSGGNTLTFHRGTPYLGSIRGFAISNV